MILIAYWVMAVWLIVAAIIRFVLLTSEHLPLDPLPFVSGALGLAAIGGLVAHQRIDARRDGRR
ncbi:hypothetical protein [uncultured Amnibacterium sp.]|uniref:hypothetical protein n=1 Tax=uncultured Amnibacterium sp. TaxID=1631851 RepID=UPI0035CA8E58